MNRTPTMSIITALLSAALVLYRVDGMAQSLPATAVWLAEIVDGLPAEPRMISQRDGYNNQPMFSADGAYLYFTAEREPGQTDIARFTIASDSLVWVNRSPEPEYSPTPVPGQNALSVIRVEMPHQRQRLWSISLESGNARLLMPNVEPVGYHGWIDRNTAALFILGDTFDLHLARIGDQPSAFLAANIGRTIRKHPGSGNILFVDKNTEPWAISSIDPESGDQSAIISLFPGHEDFEVDTEGRLWMGSGSKLYRSNPANNHWELVADFQDRGIGGISRLAVSGDLLHCAIVSGR